jgi:hypothetical protein
MADPIQVLRTRDRLKRVRGGRDGLYPFLEHLTWDVVQYFDDFLGDTLSGTYEIITGVDGAITLLANQENGVAELRASDGAGADNEYGGASLPELNWTGERNAIMACRLQIDALATVKVECGFTDVTTDAGAVNVLATPSFTAANAAVWVLDTDDTANWQAVGVKAGTAATKIEPGTPPVAATYETLIVQLRDTNAKFWRLNAAGGAVYESEWMTDAITADTALVPWVFVQLRTGTLDRNVKIDFIDVRARRTT